MLKTYWRDRTRGMRDDDGTASFWNFLHVSGYLYGVLIGVGILIGFVIGRLL